MGITENNKLIYKLLSDKDYRVLKKGAVLKRARKKTKFSQAPTFYADNERLKIRYKRKNLFVSRIIYAAFGAERLSDKKVIDHKNGKRLDNRIKNLQQITHKENSKKKAKDKKFTDAQVKYMRKLKRQGVSYYAISRIMHRPTRSVVWAIKHAKYKRGKRA